ncbi:GNAT family N-acetyltransferase [uncultured Roseibium sp.]|uniref:GNAT family N-acetyltransferase n=1 Tax=uncultured Roseibium sp. TaxID=1936171 RepID=UPI0032180F38
MAVQSASDYKFSSADAFNAIAPAAEMSRSAFTTEGFDVTIYRDLEKAAPAWRALEEQAIGLPYQRFGWIQAWYEAVGRDRFIEPVLVIARQNNIFAFALPLGLEHRRGRSALTFLGQENTNQNTGLWNPDCYATITADTLTATLEEVCHLAGADLLHLANVPQTWNNRPSPLLLKERTDSPSPSFVGRLTNDFDGLFRSNFSKKSAKTLVRKQRKLEAAGNFRVFKAETEADIRRGLEAFFTQRAKREADAGIPSGFSTPEKRRFLETLAGLHRDNGAQTANTQITVWALEVGDAIRATYLTLHQGSRLICYSTSISHDELVSQSPGVVLLKNIIEHACAEPEIDILDLGLGDETYKHPWSEPQALSDSFLAVTARGWMNLQADKATQFVKAKIRNSQRLWTLVRKLRQFLRKRGA